MGPVRRWRGRAADHGAGRHAAAASPRACLDLRGPRHASISAPCPPSSGFRRATAPGSAFRHYPASGPATGRVAIVVHGSSGPAAAPSTRCRAALAARGVETWAVDIRGHGASGTRGDIGYVGQLEDDLADFVARRPQDRADRAADAGRPFLRRRLCAARGGLADPEPVRAHRAARALSRLRCPDHPAEFRRLGQGRYPAHRWPRGAARHRHQLLRGAAGAGVRGAAEFGEEPGRRPIPTG